MFIFIKKGSCCRKDLPRMEKCADNQTNELLTLAKAGDARAFELLLDAYSPLIESSVSGFCTPEQDAVNDREDLRQEACIAFFESVKKFDLSQGDVQFGLFAKICIRNRLISYQRKMRRQPILAYDAPALAAENEDLSDALVAEENYLSLYARITSILSPYENRVWWLYLSGRTAREIGNAVGRDERSVQNAIYRIRRKLRRELPAP